MVDYSQYQCKWIPCVVGIILGVGGIATMWVGLWSWHLSMSLQNGLTFGGIAMFFIGIGCCIYSFFNETCCAMCCKRGQSDVPDEHTSLKNDQSPETPAV